MNILLLPFPAIDPIMLQIGPLAIRWYGAAYAVSIIGAYFYLRRLLRLYPATIKHDVCDDLIVPIILGIVLGGRLGYILFYGLPHFLNNPLEILMVWKGGMSFHGGLIGVILAIFRYAHKQHLPALAITDVMAMGGPLGLFLGRIANFINGEHYGRATDVPWAMIFPHGGSQPRHPSQLYEAIGEGLIIWGLLYIAWRFQPQQRTCAGYISGLFLLAYGCIRSIVELFRQPDALLYAGTIVEMTLGQALCLPMILGGSYLIWRTRISTE